MKSDEQLLAEMLPREKDILGKVQEIRRKARNSALREAIEIVKKGHFPDNSYDTEATLIGVEKAILALIK